MKHWRKFHVASTIITIVLTSGCSNEASERTRPERAIAVRAAVVGTAEESPAIRAVGTAGWRNETAVSFTNGGQIARILVN